ncbi:MAG: Gfo/Idh/MocA family oxidoreductase [Planctomycetota bacterium]|nr:Gfo/Idh/MocA family oxidoreductase [Planctomycetota bacterium]
MSRITRRRFLTASLATGAAAWLTPRSRVLGANDDIRIAIVGCGGKGGDHFKSFRGMKGVRVVAICDPDQSHTGGFIKAAEKDNPGKIEAYQQYQKLLENKDIDAVVLATPNHWHALGTVWGCQAGKDVYCEKPSSHEIWEGRKAVEAARKHNRIVQAGTQHRSGPGLQAAFEYLHKGEIGKILYARGFCYKPRGSIGKVTAPTPIPKGVDYDQWCGPAPMDPLMRKNLHYDWHWVWPTGNGDIGNQGIHEMDLCRWALNQPGLPARVFSFGGRFVYDDDATTPNTLISFYDYKPAPLIFEVRGLPRKKGKDEPMDAYKNKVRIGIAVICEGGIFMGGAGGGGIYDKDGNPVMGKDGKPLKFVGESDHRANFLKAVRSRKKEDLAADIELCHLSSALCHLGNISYRLGKNAKLEDIAEIAKADKEAQDSLERFKAHLTANEADLLKTPAVLGPWLTFDPDKEQFTGPLAEEANKLVTREYRKPYVVPEQV